MGRILSKNVHYSINHIFSEKKRQYGVRQTQIFDRIIQNHDNKFQ